MAEHNRQIQHNQAAAQQQAQLQAQQQAHLQQQQQQQQAQSQGQGQGQAMLSPRPMVSSAAPSSLNPSAGGAPPQQPAVDAAPPASVASVAVLPGSSGGHGGGGTPGARGHQQAGGDGPTSSGADMTPEQRLAEQHRARQQAATFQVWLTSPALERVVALPFGSEMQSSITCQERYASAAKSVRSRCPFRSRHLCHFTVVLR